jgi:cell wall-associated NlpC family hydrolase
MIDGITIIAWAPIVAALRATTGTAAPWAVPNWDSRECPGPNSEASLSRPSTGRVLAASALALAVSAPALESVEPPTEIVRAQVSVPAAAARQPRPELRLMQRVSRSTAHRTATRPTVVALRAARRSEARESARISVARRESQARRAARHRAAEGSARSRATEKSRVSARYHGRHRGEGRARVRMSSVIEYARSQVGKNYRRGGDGPNSFDCSGFTKRAYARVGLRLPHSSGGQAARARSISRNAARPGDLVVGPGHVGIYMGGGMMIDAGNPHTGVVFRRLYGGLHIERF